MFICVVSQANANHLDTTVLTTSSLIKSVGWQENQHILEGSQNEGEASRKILS